MNKLIKTLALGVILAMAGSASAQKVGHADVQALMDTMPEMDTVRGSLLAIANEYSAQLETMESDLKKKYADFDAKSKSPNVTPKMMENLQMDIQRMEESYNNLRQQAQQDLQQQQLMAMTPLRDKVQKTLETIAKEKGYSYVLDSSSGIIIVQSKADDLTQIALKRLTGK